MSVWFPDNRQGAPVEAQISADCWHGGEHVWTPSENRVGKMVEERCEQCHITRWRVQQAPA